MVPRKRRQTDRGSRPSPFLNLAHCGWHPIFATRREDIQYTSENKALIDGLELEDDGVVRTFVKSYDESDACLPRAEKVEQWCFGASLEAFQEDKKGDDLVNKYIAWLDERGSVEGKVQAREYRGPLTAQRLYEELKKPRFHIKRATSTTTSDNKAFLVSTAESDADESPSVRRRKRRRGKQRKSIKGENKKKLEEFDVEMIGHEEEGPPPDAEQRKIFITDLDRWGIYALIGTASENQALGLRDAIYKHLAFESFIGVTFPSAGFATFQLAFHIPFYAWRTSARPQEDHRLDRNADRLRQSRNVSFLNWKNSVSSDFLYEAQISCLVTGSDEWRWVAYGFVDTYFDHEARESVEGYHDDTTKEGGMNADPLTFGVIDAERAIPTAREYFLSVFRIRIAQVKREWEQVVEKIRQSIREYEQTHSYSLCISRERSSSTAAKEHDDKVRRSRDWIVQVKRLTTQLSQRLSKTADACEKFRINHVIFFQNLSEPPNGDRALSFIQTTFDELESLKKELDSLVESCGQFAQDLELHLILQNVEMGNLQQKIAEDNKGLALIMMLYISPVALSAGILSMNKDVISFIPASFGSFVGLVFVFSVLGILIHVILQYQTWYWQVVMTLAGQKSWQEMLLRRKTQDDVELRAG